MIDAERSQPPPASLKEGGAFKEDVKERLERDFHQKCYLCESELGANLQVDHFRPKKEFPDLEYEWGNLFPTDKCNQRRRRKWPKGGFLDPTASYPIESRLAQWIATDYAGVRSTCFESAQDDDEAARNSADELEKLHNEDRNAARNLRDAIFRQYVLALRKYREYLEAVVADEALKAKQLRRELLVMLSPKAPYSGLIRGSFRREPGLPKDIAAALK